MPSPPHATALPVVLSLACSDPSGGGGNVGAALSIAAAGAHAACVTTGLSVRDTRNVERFWPVEAELIDEQARAVLEDLPVSAFHVGTLADARTAAMVAALVADYPSVPVVLDPDLYGGRDDGQIDEDLIGALCELLLPQCALFIPNSIEARLLADDQESDGPAAGRSLAECAQILLDSGCEHVLITGSHEPTAQVINTLYGIRGVVRTDAWERLSGSYLGAGITLSAAITARLARGEALSDAARSAQAYVWQTLANAQQLGMGRRIPHRPLGGQP